MSTQKTLYLHIGTYKTATTFLQYVLRHNLNDPSGSIYYPSVDTYGDAHHYLTTPTFPAWKERRTEAQYADSWKSVLEQIHSSCAAKIVLSSEMFCSLPQSRIEIIREFLSEFDVKAIIYFRRQDQYFSSLAAQLIKGCHGKPEYYSDINAALGMLMDSDRHNYLKICNAWSAVIGKENLIVRPFERQQFFNGDIASDFYHHFFNLPIPEKLKKTTENLNPRLCRDSLKFKQLINRLSIDRSDMNAFLPDLFSYSESVEIETKGLYQNHVLLSPRQRVDILSSCEYINNTVAKEYINRAKEHLFLDDLPDIHEPWDSYSGLSSDKISEIISYIHARSPFLIDLLLDAVGKTNLYRKSPVSEAAKTLGKALDLYGFRRKSLLRYSMWNLLNFSRKIFRKIKY